LNAAKEAGATTIKSINIVIGDMASIIDDCIQFYFDFLSENTIAQGAQLSFRRIPMTVRCRHCDITFTPAGETWECPQCQKWDVEITAGKEFYLDSLEVE
jgi:hydrogenase nickel incorporation protein HypA/HybF